MLTDITTIANSSYVPSAPTVVACVSTTMAVFSAQPVLASLHSTSISLQQLVFRCFVLLANTLIMSYLPVPSVKTSAINVTYLIMFCYVTSKKI